MLVSIPATWRRRLAEFIASLFEISEDNEKNFETNALLYMGATLFGSVPAAVMGIAIEARPQLPGQVYLLALVCALLCGYLLYSLRYRLWRQGNRGIHAVGWLFIATCWGFTLYAGWRAGFLASST